jgi:hypothetical protein
MKPVAGRKLIKEFLMTLSALGDDNQVCLRPAACDGESLCRAARTLFPKYAWVPVHRGSANNLLKIRSNRKSVHRRRIPHP